MNYTQRDLFTDTWVANDDLQRKVTTESDRKEGKKVGIFYFLWHDAPSDAPLIDHSKAFEEGGPAKLEETMKSGPMGYAHYWAEPYFGYYRADDEWVIRKHAYMLTAAGIDFIFIDITNAITYKNTYEKLLKVWNDIRNEGQTTPEIMFITNTKAASTVNKVYNDLYKPGLYENLWFRYDGKPLILVPKNDIELLSDEVRSFFTIRSSWAYTKDEPGKWYTDNDGKNCWPWADLYPQYPGKSPEGKTEQMIVMCGFWVNGSYGTNAGRSFNNGHQPDNLTDRDYGYSLVTTVSGQGLAFKEQFEYALKVNPDIIMITGWNEWWAGRWGSINGVNPANGQKIANTYMVEPGNDFKDNYFVDNFNPEYSRDIEPVKGYYNDNYYYQMCGFIRKFKGGREVPKVSGNIGRRFYTHDMAEWDKISPEYRDFCGDTCHRNWPSSGGGLTYINESGRNDLISMKVCSDKLYLYFYVKCEQIVTKPSGTNWMNLFINSDCNYQNGWYGYDYVINRLQQGNKASIEAFIDSEWKFEQIGEADLRIKDNILELRVPKGIVRVQDVFDFKWADNSVDDGDVRKFMDQGDCAPDGRFNYRCRLK